jgi:hypothetical protein
VTRRDFGRFRASRPAAARSRLAGATQRSHAEERQLLRERDPAVCLVVGRLERGSAQNKPNSALVRDVLAGLGRAIT